MPKELVVEWRTGIRNLKKNIWNNGKKYNQLDVYDIAQDRTNNNGFPRMNYRQTTMENGNIAAAYLIFKITPGQGDYGPVV